MKYNVVEERELLFSLDKGDFTLEFFCTGGKGGQNQNKRKMGVRIKHAASGAVAESREERSQLQNRKIAFRRLVETEAFKKWHKIECSKRLGNLANIDDLVDRWMDDSNIKIEVKDENGRWVEVGMDELDLSKIKAAITGGNDI